MLKRKLAQQTNALGQAKASRDQEPTTTISNLFATPLWLRFYQIEEQLSVSLAQLCPSPSIVCTYNPVEYAAALHCSYLRRYLDAPKKLIFIGMNPGPNGMGQTGVPFGNVRTVRDLMLLTGEVNQPPVLHPKRPVRGLECRTEEPSGVRLWELFQRLAGGHLNTFAQQCFVHNLCPLAFFDAAGHNITPSELKPPYKKQIQETCLQALEQQLQLVKPQIVVAVGDYVFQTLKRSLYCGQKGQVPLLRLTHPSPRSLNNTNWPEKAEAFLQEHGLLALIRNEAT